MSDNIKSPIFMGCDFALEKDITVVHNIKTESFTYYPPSPKVYYSSSWTGRISKEEQCEINLKKLVLSAAQKRIEKNLNNLMLFGTTSPPLFKKRDDSVDAFAYGLQRIVIKKKPFLKRFFCSYRGWRGHLGILASLKAAWRISNV